MIFLLNDGFFKNYPRPISSILTGFWFFGNYLSISGVAIQFFFRYTVLCKNGEFAHKKLIIIFTIMICYYIFNSWLWTTSYVASENDVNGYYRRILKNYSYFTEDDVAFNVGTMVSYTTIQF